MRVDASQGSLIAVAAIGWSISGETVAAGSLWTDVDHASEHPDLAGRHDGARAWAGVAAERSRQGAYDAALDATRRQMALGHVDAVVMGNAAQLLMALGRLDEAIEQYREALTLDERDHTRNGRGDLQHRAVYAWGLAAALDRSGKPSGAREAIDRALAIDDAMAMLRRDRRGDGDLLWVSPPDAFYCLGLAYERTGRTDDAVAAFHSYLASVRPDRPNGQVGGTPGGYAERARDHLARLLDGKPTERRQRRGEGGPARWRVVHEATVSADGPLVAPLIDAAWRLHGKMLDACLSDVEVEFESDVVGVPAGAAPRDLRLRLELTLDENGVARAVTAEVPVGVAGTLGACIEEEIRARFSTSKPTRRKPTRARIELLLAPAEASGL